MTKTDQTNEQLKVAKMKIYLVIAADEGDGNCEVDKIFTDKKTALKYAGENLHDEEGMPLNVSESMKPEGTIEEHEIEIPAAILSRFAALCEKRGAVKEVDREISKGKSYGAAMASKYKRRVELEREIMSLTSDKPAKPSGLAFKEMEG